MTFSTRGTPRIGQSAPALTSLGAVGGPRGVGAAGLRILVEFLTVYNKEAAEEVAGDLAKLQHAGQVAAIAEEKRLQRLGQVRRQLSQADSLIRGRLNTAQRRELKTVEALSALTTKSGKERAESARTALNATLKASGLSEREIGLINKRLNLRKEEGKLVQRQEAAEERSTQRQKATNQVLAQRDRIAQQRSGIGGRLAGLAVGALGGVVGGAVIGVGFQIAQDALSALGDKLLDIVDPGRHARDAILEVGGAIAKMAEQEQISLRVATVKYLHDLGLAAEDSTVSLLANAAAQKQLADAIAARKLVAEIAEHGDAQEKQNRKDLTETLIKEAKANGTYTESIEATDQSLTDFNNSGAVTQFINGIRVEDVVTAELNKTLANLARISLEAAAAQAELASKAAFAAIMQRQLQGAISGAFESSISSLGSGESSRTKGLQSRVDALRNKGSAPNNRDQLKAIAEERELIFLRQRLRLLGTNINLERYSGKFLLEAINAKINALQKEGDAQSRLNKLLDLQYNQTKVITRQQGESINDFIERRAQEQRHQLQETADLERETRIASLEDLRDKVQDEVRLAELAEEKKRALRKTGTDNALRELEKQLAASKKADADALQAKIKALKAQQEKVLFYSDQTNIEQIQAAIRGARTVQDIYALSGEIQGLESARTFLQALLTSGALTPAQAAAVKATIASIMTTVNAATKKFNIIQFGYIKGGNINRMDRIGLAEGGVIELDNARSPFGQNRKFGEQGTELGVVLSNKVASILKQQQGGGVQMGDVNFYGENDWRTQLYMFRQAVREVIREELR